MIDVRVVPIGSDVLPDDLVAPFGGDECCGGEWWLATINQVALAAAGAAPLIAPCCGRRFGVRNIGLVDFVSKAEWEAIGDDGPAPQTYNVGHAFKLPGIAS